jgi:lipid-binding SYLF domain-containing protein
MTTSRTLLIIVLTALIVLGTASCSSSPQTPSQRKALVSDADATLETMLARDSDLAPLLDRAAGYAIFPNVGKGGVIVGGAFGRGAVYRGGGAGGKDRALEGYARVTQGSVGGTIGARAFALLLVFENEADLKRFTNGSELAFGAEATAIAITEGSSATTRFDNGVAVFAMPKGGLMADASLSGQKFSFERAFTDGAEATTKPNMEPKNESAQISTD